MLETIRGCKKWLIIVCDYLINISPVIFAAIALYFIFLVIIPFFFLGIYAIPEKRLFLEQVRYDQAFGNIAGVVGVFLGQTDVLSFILTPVWLLSLISLIRTRKPWIVITLLIGPLPIAYFAAGPYANAMQEWLIYL